MIHYHWRPLLAGLTILILSSLVPATPLQAQQSQGSITGKLTDQKGNPLAQVIVTLPELNRHAISDTSGRFRLTGLPAGDWQLKIHSIGFLDHVQIVHVSPGVVTTLDMHLSDDVKALDGVTVAAVKRTASQDLKESGFNVNAIETRSYQTRTTDLSQLLDKTTGIKVRASGGVGSDYSFSVNGLSGKAIKYFVDGVPMDVFGSTMSLNNIPVNLAERVEVYKGVVPVQLGADAMGGSREYRDPLGRP
jgi:outer membrane receptor protein involved in Fe transport